MADNQEKLQSLVEEYQCSWKLPGLAVAVVDSKGRTFEAAAGFADIENERAFLPDTVFPVASISSGNLIEFLKC